MMTKNIEDIKSVKYDSKRNATVVETKQGSKFGWRGSQAKSNFTQLVKDMNKSKIQKE